MPDERVIVCREPASRPRSLSDHRVARARGVGPRIGPHGGDWVRDHAPPRTPPKTHRGVSGVITQGLRSECGVVLPAAEGGPGVVPKDGIVDAPIDGVPLAAGGHPVRRVVADRGIHPRHQRHHPGSGHGRRVGTQVLHGHAVRLDRLEGAAWIAGPHAEIGRGPTAHLRPVPGDDRGRVRQIEGVVQGAGEHNVRWIPVEQGGGAPGRCYREHPLVAAVDLE